MKAYVSLDWKRAALLPSQLRVCVTEEAECRHTEDGVGFLSQSGAVGERAAQSSVVAVTELAVNLGAMGCLFFPVLVLPPPPPPPPSPPLGPGGRPTPGSAGPAQSSSPPGRSCRRGRSRSPPRTGARHPAPRSRRRRRCICARVRPRGRERRRKGRSTEETYRGEEARTQGRERGRGKRSYPQEGARTERSERRGATPGPAGGLLGSPSPAEPPSQPVQRPATL